MRVTSHFDGGLLRHADVRLTQLHTPRFGGATEFDDRRVIQFGIGRERDVLFLHGRIDDNLRQFSFRNLLRAQRQSDGLLQQLGELLRADALSPFGQRCRMQRHLVLHRFVPTKVLPVGILDPAIEERLVGFVEGVLQIVQSDQQPNRFGGRAGVGAVAVFEGQIEALPVDLVGQDVERMLVVEQLLEAGVEQIELAGFRFWSGLHADLKLQGNGPSRFDCLQF